MFRIFIFTRNSNIYFLRKVLVCGYWFYYSLCLYMHNSCIFIFKKILINKFTNGCMHYYLYMIKHSISTKRFTMKSKFSFHPRLRVSFPTSNKQFYVFSCLCRNFLCICLLTFFAYIKALSGSIYQCFMVIFPY